MGNMADVPTPNSLPTIDIETDLRRVRRARSIRRVLMTVVAGLVIAGLSSFLGPRSSSVSGSGDGYQLTLRFPRITRPGLAIRWILQVRHPGGFAGPVTISTDRDYFDLFDFNSLDPVPSSQTVDGTRSVWQFDPPPGDLLTVAMDARTEPAQQLGKEAVTDLLVNGVAVVSLRYATRVMP